MWKGRDALQCLFPVLLAFLPSAFSFPGQPKYMVLAPSQLYTETPQKICFHLYNLDEKVTVKASLEAVWGSRNLVNQLVADRDLFHCASFTLPQIPSSDEVFLSVNIKGLTHEFRKKNEVFIQNKESVVFVQTDKSVYKPGQSVKFRIVSMDKNLHPLNELFPLAYIEDPKSNRIMQWRDISTENGLKQLSFSLSSEPIQGSYKIGLLKQSGAKKEHIFTVEEFVLPRFEVQVKVPKSISVQDEKINVTVCAVYTYGKPVPGQVKMLTCGEHQLPTRVIKMECKETSYQLDNNGCITEEENITAFQFKEKHYEVQNFRVIAYVKEDGTDLELTRFGKTKIEKATSKFITVKADSHFKRGIPFLVKFRLVDVKGSPLPNEQVFIKSRELGYTNATTTDQHGLAEFSINTTNIEGASLTLKVYHKEENSCLHYPCTAEEHAEKHHVAYSVYSSSGSYVHLKTEAEVLPCSQNHTVQAHFIIKGFPSMVLEKLTFYYLVMAKGSIIQTGMHTHHMDPGQCFSQSSEMYAVFSCDKVTGDFALEIPVEASMAPMAKILIYTILPNGEVIADSAKFEIEKCLPNKVDLSFSPAQSLPASQAHLRLTASPQSLCGLRAVDQSVLLLKPEAELSPSWIYKLPEMQHRKFIQKPDPIFEDDMFKDHGEMVGEKLKNINEKDVYDYMEDMGLKAFTNLKIKISKLCVDYDTLPSLAEPAVAHGVTNRKNSVTMTEVAHEDPPREDPPHEDPPTETIRSYFPETWIWDLVTVNSSGVAEMEVTVPDTITEWKAGALCLSNDTGLGISPVVSLQAFQPFFVELMMPYSVIRGEDFTLKATVLNYLPKCIRVGVLLEDSPDFTAVPVAKDQDSYCLCANERHTTSWLVTPKSLGNVNFSVTAEAQQSPEPCGSEMVTVPETGKRDTVIKMLVVEPEGIKKEHTFSSLLCGSDARTPEKLSLMLPPSVVKDSARAHFSVLGDIMSSAIKNLQNLLHMPYGCGEQNMVLFAPNIYVLKYLNETQQLTQKIKSKAIGYLIAGYQRELNYKHKDGSYSAFGDQGGRTQGNTW
ncbi:alpha-1-inhibitor 3-like [Sigmodon hispidus]